MADEVVKGINGFTLVKQDLDWAIETGWALVKSYRGPQALKDACIAALQLEGASKIRASTGVPCEIQATYAVNPSGYNGDQAAEDNAVWELIGETVEKRLETHGKFNVTGSSQEVLNLIDKAISDGTACDTNWDSVYSGLGAFNAYRDLRLMGVDSYETYTYRVRKTLTVTPDTMILPTITIPGKVIQWSSIRVPSSARFRQPSIHMVLPMQGSVAGFSDELVNEWLVQPPSITWDKRGRRWTITQEYVGAVKISGTLYDGGGMTP